MKVKKKTIWITSGVLAVLLLATAITGVILLTRKNKAFDYLHEDLSPYLQISEKDYRGYPLTVDADGVTEDDIEMEILKTLVKNKSKEARFGGAAVKNQTVTPGDELAIWYRGYLTDEEGHETEVENACNFTSDDPGSLEIGSGSFVPGFELGLLGKNSADYAPFKKIRSGAVTTDCVAYFTYSYVSAGKTQTDATGRYDFTIGNADDLWGVGFGDFLLSQKIGETYGDMKSFSTGGDVETIYYNLTVNFITTCENAPITVDGYFPIDYENSEELRGKTVHFDVYIVTSIVYDTPELTEEFITETLKMEASGFDAYEGETLPDRYRSYVREGLLANYRETFLTAAEEAVWEHLHKVVHIDGYPESDVQAVYDDYVAGMKAQYKAYSTKYTLDKFARMYFDMDDEEDMNWQQYVRTLAESAVAEKLIFYSIARRENLLPDDEQFRKLYDELVDESVLYYAQNYYKITEDKYKTHEEYLKALADIRDEVIASYTEEYFNELVYYRFAIDKIIGFADATISGRKGIEQNEK